MSDHLERGKMSRMEVTIPDGSTRSDYRTAHHRAGDPGYKRFIPKTCYECWQQGLSAQEAWGRTPTAPDQDWSQEVTHGPGI